MTITQLRQIRVLTDGTRTATAIATAIGISADTVRARARREGLPLAHTSRRRLDHADVLRLADEGHSAREIAARVGCSVRTVHGIAAGRLRCAGGEKIRPAIPAPNMVSVVRSGSRWVVMTSTTCDSEAEARVIERRYRATP